MKEHNVQLWCQDEVHFQRHSTLTRMWATKGQQPRVLSASTREKVGYFGAINLKTGCLLTQESTTFNGETFGEFLHHVLQHSRGKLYLILDNASYHRSRYLKEFLFQNRHRLVRLFLPPYSPELNPIERVWRITRRQVTHNRYFGSLDQLRAALVACFAKWEQPNTALKVLCAHI